MKLPIALSFLFAPLGWAQDSAHVAEASWTAWRGPLGTGAAPAADPPVQWSEDENIAWKVDLPGHGKSTPVVHGDRVYILAAEGTRPARPNEIAQRPSFEGQRTEAPDVVHEFLVLAFDRASGELVWRTEVAERLPVGGVHQTNGYASYSPVTDGELLYAPFGSYGLYALDLEQGEVQWSFEIGPQNMRRGFGEGGSPALAGELLIVVADQEDDSFIYALDKRSGELRWKKPRDERSTWTTPLVVQADGKTQVIVNGTTAVRSYDAASGDILWECSGQTGNPVPTPVTDGEHVICMSGFRGAACFAFALDGRGDLRESEDAIAWSHDVGTPYVPSPLLVDERVYFLSGNSGLLSCLDLNTGEVLLDRERLDMSQVYASPIAAGGRIYVAGRDGSTVVLSHSDELEILATNMLENPIDATPVAVGEALFVRTDEHLYAIGKP